MNKFENELGSEIKKEFQLERLVFFTDAVFAIAITLLVIDLKIPNFESITSEDDYANRFIGIVPNLFSFTLSFFVIGMYWESHHMLFSFVVKWDRPLLWLNIFFLFSIILMPFTTAGLFSLPLRMPWLIYSINICLIGFFKYLLVKHLANLKNKLTVDFEDKKLIKNLIHRSIMVPVVFILSVIVSYFAQPFFLGRFVPMLIPIYSAILNRKYGKLKI